MALQAETWPAHCRVAESQCRQMATETATAGEGRIAAYAVPRKGQKDKLPKVSLLVLPFAGPGTEPWVLVIAAAAERPSYQEEDLRLAEQLCHFLGIAITNSAFVATLQHQNITDDLTGLYNARHFHELLDYELERARRYGDDLSLVFLDLDYFKQVNDAHGHLVGSRLLREVGEMIKEQIRRVNLACRYGGDEFVVLLPSTSKAGALVMAEHLRNYFHTTPFHGGGNHNLHITASFGVASYPGDARTKDELIDLADSAMYQVKASGRDGVPPA